MEESAIILIPQRERIWIEAQDNCVFDVEKDIGITSPFIKREALTHKHGTSKDSPIILPKPVSTSTLNLVFDYCRYHRVSGRSDKERKLFDEKFIRLDTRTLCEMTSAADALDIKPLVELTSKGLARIIEGKSPEEIREIFHLPDDLTEEEKLEPVKNVTDDPRIRLLNRLYARKRRELLELNKPLKGVETKKVVDERSVDDLLSFIDGTSGEAETSRTTKTKKKKRKNKKDSSSSSRDTAEGDKDSVQDCSLGQDPTVSQSSEIKDSLPLQDSGSELNFEASLDSHGKGSDRLGVDRELAGSFESYREGTDMDGMERPGSSRGEIGERHTVSGFEPGKGDELILPEVDAKESMVLPLTSRQLPEDIVSNSRLEVSYDARGVQREKSFSRVRYAEDGIPGDKNARIVERMSTDFFETLELKERGDEFETNRKEMEPNNGLAPAQYDQLLSQRLNPESAVGASLRHSQLAFQEGIVSRISGQSLEPTTIAAGDLLAPKLSHNPDLSQFQFDPSRSESTAEGASLSGSDPSQSLNAAVSASTLVKGLMHSNHEFLSKVSHYELESSKLPASESSDGRLGFSASKSHEISGDVYSQTWKPSQTHLPTDLSIPPSGLLMPSQSAIGLLPPSQSGRPDLWVTSYGASWNSNGQTSATPIANPSSIPSVSPHVIPDVSMFPTWNSNSQGPGVHQESKAELRQWDSIHKPLSSESRSEISWDSSMQFAGRSLDLDSPENLLSRETLEFAGFLQTVVQYLGFDSEVEVVCKRGSAFSPHFKGQSEAWRETRKRIPCLPIMPRQEPGRIQFSHQLPSGPTVSFGVNSFQN